MPEGDTIAYAAQRMRPVLEGQVPDEIRTPQPRHALDRWPERLAGPGGQRDPHPRQAPVPALRGGPDDPLASADDRLLGRVPAGTAVAALAAPGVAGARARRHQVVQFDGPVLELLTDSRTRFDQRLAALGPDILAAEFDYRAFPRPAARRRPHARDRRRPARSAQRRRDRQPVEGRGLLGRGRSTRGAASATCHDEEARRGHRRGSARGCSSPRGPAIRTPAGGCSAATAGRAPAAARRSAPAARATTTGRPSGARAASGDAGSAEPAAGRAE